MEETAPPKSGWSVYNTSRAVLLEVKGAGSGGSGKAVLRVLNSTCSIAKAVWMKEMASVTWPSSAQLETLMEASKYCEEVRPIVWSSTGTATLELELEAYAAVSVSFTRSATN